MTKRIFHYLILASVLLGVPALCAWLGGFDEIWEGVKSFPPRTEDWGFHPEKLWNRRCPFSWTWFIGMAALTLLCTFALARRAVRAAFAKTPGAASPKRRFPFPWWGWLGVAILAVAWTFAWNRFAWFAPLQPHTYLPLWIGYILIMNGLTVRRAGSSPMTRHPVAFLLTFPASSLFWWFFEYLNRYVWNWYYVGIAQMSALEYTVYATLCFTSVLPAITSTAAWLHTFRAFRDDAYDGMANVDLRRPKWMLFLLALSTTGLVGIVHFPQYAYPLLWLSPLSMFLFIQFLLGEPSVMDRTRSGNWALFFRFAVAALVCGLCWETWNYYSYAKWIYAVPFVHAFQIWEMPFIGFAGYLPFGVECAAVTAWICPYLVEDAGEA